MLRHYQNAHHPLSAYGNYPFCPAQLPQDALKLQPACIAPLYVFLPSSGPFSSLGHHPLQDRVVVY